MPGFAARHPHRRQCAPSHLVTVMHQQVSEEQPTSTQKVLDAIRRLRGETDDDQGL